MPTKFEFPLTRADEIRRARGIDQPELALRAVVNRSILSRAMNGRRPLVREAPLAKKLAAVFECEIQDLFDPIGTPIPPRKSLAPADLTPGDVLSGAGYLRRQGVLATVLGISIDAMMRYLVYGDFANIPQALAVRIRQAQDEAEERDSRGN